MTGADLPQVVHPVLDGPIRWRAGDEANLAHSVVGKGPGQALNLAGESLSRLHQALPYLTDDQLVEAFAYASSFGKRSWLVQAAILYEA